MILDSTLFDDDTSAGSSSSSGGSSSSPITHEGSSVKYGFLYPVNLVSQDEYQWQKSVLTNQEVEKLKKTVEFQTFVSDPIVKLKEPAKPYIPLKGLLFVVPILLIIYYMQPELELPLPPEQSLAPDIYRPLCLDPKCLIPSTTAPILWAKPEVKRGLSTKRIPVNVPPRAMGLKVIPVDQRCDGESTWIEHYGNGTRIMVPLPEPGISRLCLRDDEHGIIDQSSPKFVVCGVTRVNSPLITAAGQSFILNIEGHCLEGPPKLTLIPMGQTECHHGTDITGLHTDTGWSFNIEVNVGSVPFTCVRIAKEWVKLPRLVVLGATNYVVTEPKVGSVVQVTVSGIDMDQNPKMLLISAEDNCSDLEGLEGLPALSASSSLAVWEVYLRTYKDPINPKEEHWASPRWIKAGVELKVCVGWDGEFLPVGDSFTVINDVSYFVQNLIMSAAILVGIALFLKSFQTPSRDAPNICSVCWEASCSIAFNCGHVCTCGRCSTGLTSCPVCRTKIKRRLRVYFP